MTKEELEHDHIKEIAENYINESWGSFADLSGVDLVMAGIGVAKIISKEKEKWISELEKRCANYEMTISKMEKGTCDICKETEKDKKIEELEAQLRKMKSIGRTSYIKGIRTMANALKDYDRTDGAWTDYFEHTVDKVLQREQLNFEEYGTLADQLTKAKELLKQWLQTSKASGCDNINIVTDTEQFLKDSEVEK